MGKYIKRTPLTMVLITDNVILDLLIIATTSLAAIYAYFQYAYTYWERKGVPFLPPKFPLGNSFSIFAKNSSHGIEISRFYVDMKKRGYKFGGIYLITHPKLIILDPDYIRDVLAKDFPYFLDRGQYHNEKDDPISTHLFSLAEDSKWRNMRTKLTPTFTSGKMKMMFQTVLDISQYMIDAIEKCAVEKKDIDIQDFLSCFTIDVIGVCAFGIECNSFKNPEAEFRRMGMKLFDPSGMRRYKLILINKLPDLALKLGLKGTRPEVAKFFHDVTERTVSYRERNNLSRPDFLQLLIDLKNSSKDSQDPFTMEQLVAHVFLFFLAGFDTSSITMNFAIYELCKNPDIQEKLREEINQVLENHDGKITYDSLGEMKYLQQVIDESQRLYPPVANLTRKCVKDYKLRDTDITIEKGTHVIIPLYALHRDAEYYPDPDRFDPDRFSSENKKSRHPFVHLPFGEGPRNCIGIRFGLMQSKIGLIRILKKFRLRISPTTSMPLRLDDKVLLLKSINKLYLQAERI